MSVEATVERVLRLLALLQRRPSWTAAELAAELGVTDRSVRRDVERLRAVGYPVHATAGVGGGYQLGAGTRLPPLLLDDEEAIATAVSLRLASGGTVAGAGDAALRALAKLDQVMPPRLRAEVRAVHGATETLVAGIEIDAELLVTLARACRDAVRVRFRYSSRGSEDRERTVEPVRMVATNRRWYLMAWDLDRDDWRTFRLDRMREVTATTWRFRPREHPAPVAYVQRSVSAAPYRYLAKVRLRAGADEVRDLVPPQVGRVEEDRDGWCLLVAGGDQLDWLAVHVARLGYEAEILEPPELREAAARLAERVAAMAGDTQTPTGRLPGAD
ncbi:helix-turn-helix transcriptional regulator [Amycolatopsis thermoflava]|uniref:Putative DNA-binding transcriptional regulator YafY n=1 Tax=Amycolatopsis thermoflava TaxID=84480 RepID=A0A3N2GXC9_9PSEU|nr:YafY family protein [Amycolatopsis thermoflava]ROS41247.1 putative DNA-binding transcriptional regulator YafY [Amycolatopsis thermoflava]